MLVGLTATGSIAASISVSGNAFEVISTQLRGTGFEQFGSIATQANGTQHPSAAAEMPDQERVIEESRAGPCVGMNIEGI